MFINKLKIYKDYKIYIATDDHKALDIFKNELKDYNFFYYFQPYNANGENIHFNDPDKDNIIMSILVDMYMLYQGGACGAGGAEPGAAGGAGARGGRGLRPIFHLPT